MSSPATLPQPPVAAAPAPSPAPAPQTEQQAPAAPASPPAPPARQEDWRDRQLTPEETENLLRGIEPAPPAPEQPTAAEQQQTQLAQQFFAEQTPVPGAPPAVIPPGVREQAAQQTAQQPPAPQQVPVQPVESQEMQALRAQNQLLQTQIQYVMAQQTQQPQRQQAPQPPTPQAPQAPSFNFNVPDNYIHALASEDINQRRAALNSLLNGVAENVAAQAAQQIEARFSSIPQTVEPMLQAHTKAQAAQQDLYGTYPELRNLTQFVQAATMAVGPNLSIDQWNADLRDAIAERVAPMVPGLFQRIQANRAQRIQQPYAQPYPNGNGYQPVPVPPVPQVPGPNGQAGIHGGPVYVKDAAGNLVPYQPQQQFVQGQQTRPQGRSVDPMIQDIWTTLNF